MSEDDDDDVECCMTMKEINDKHVQLRGSLNLKYPPKESRCRNTCNLNDMQVIDKEKGFTGYKNHGCFLTAGHNDSCEFSSECQSMKAVRV